MNLELIKVNYARDIFERQRHRDGNCSHRNKGGHPGQVFKRLRQNTEK